MERALHTLPTNSHTSPCSLLCVTLQYSSHSEIRSLCEIAQSIAVISYNKSQQHELFLNFILVKNSTCFGQTYCPSSGALILYSQRLVFVILFMLTVC
jgi:hypothetical protein